MRQPEVLNPVLVADVAAVPQRNRMIDGRCIRPVTRMLRVERFVANPADRTVALDEFANDDGPRLAAKSPKASHGLARERALFGQADAAREALGRRTALGNEYDAMPDCASAAGAVSVTVNEPIVVPVFT